MPSSASISTPKVNVTAFCMGTKSVWRRLTSEAHFLASRVWRAYRKQGGQRARILTDFLIGAHAHVQASRLPSRDRGFYGKLFPKLSLIDPSA